VGSIEPRRPSDRASNPHDAVHGKYHSAEENRTSVPRFRVRSSVVECIQGDITNQPDVDAVVNAANAELRPGGGVAGAIHRAAGPGLYQECRPLAPLRPGEAVITRGHDLPNRFVVHCLGPVYGVDIPSDVLLASCYRNALRLAHQHGVRSIAFPAISAGVFGYSVADAARVAVETVLREAIESSTVDRIRFVLFDATAFEIYQDLLTDLVAPTP